MHVDDCADALIFLLERYSGELHINVGSGEEVSIAQLAEMLMEAVGYRGVLAYDPSKPDGTPRKLMDCARLHAMGWRPKISLHSGISATYRWYVENTAGAVDHTRISKSGLQS